MSVARKKFVIQEFLNSPVDRLPSENEKLVEVIRGRGHDLHEVKEVGIDGETYIVSMPGKFRKTIWVKRGDFLLVSSIPEGDKVKAEITEILTKKRVEYLKKAGFWPKSNDDSPVEDNGPVEEFVNTNRVVFDDYLESDSSSEESD